MPATSTPEDTSIFNKWSRKFSVVTGLGITEEERLRELEIHQNGVCNRWKKELMNYSGFARRSLSRFVGIFSTRYSRPSRGFHAETARTVRVPGSSKAFELPTVQLRSLWRVRP
jgi:hypothetical protein